VSARDVQFYLDLVSPYTWLALMRAEEFGRRHAVRWDLRPVVYAALLDAHGLVGSVETEAKRRYTFEDVARCARRQGLALAAPPTHPFRSLEALRTVQLFRDAPEALALARALSDACWGKGRDLTDPGVLEETVASIGLPAGDLPARLGDPAVKEALRAQTAEAISLGVFGVPSFVLGGEIFWGHDRMDHLAERLSGELPDTRRMAAAILSRPRGADRPRRRS
jgi:2-hydroxychromene-2-carboxylate isomerase